MKKFLLHLLTILLIIGDGAIFIVMALKLLEEFPQVSAIYKTAIVMGYVSVCIAILVLTADILTYCEREINDMNK